MAASPKRKPDPKFPYMDNLRADIRLVGFPALLNPFLQNTSSSRVDMHRGHTGQSLILDGAEFPSIFTGKEYDTSRYEMCGTKRLQDAQIIAVIPKYPVRTGADPIAENPRRTVIYRGLNDDRLHYLHLDRHTKCTDGFGYENQFENAHVLSKDTFLPKEAVLSHSPAIKGKQYNLGVNANVAYMTITDTIEDAMVVSERLAEKMQSTMIKEQVITVKPNEHPLNLYGDDIDYRFLPDIGEYVREDGTLCSFRPVDINTFAADMRPGNMKDTQPLHDRSIVIAEPGAKIIDLDFYVCSRRDSIPWQVYGQVDKYTQAIMKYWERIIEVYNQYKDKSPPSPEFNTLVYRAMSHLIAHGGRVKGIQSRKQRFVTRNEQPVEFLQIKVTYMAKHKPAAGLGFKITDRHGTKGVICRVAKDEDMPVDDYGFRADLIVDPGSTIARMNIGQLYEQAINRTSEFVRRRLAAVYETDAKQAAEMLLDYYNDINPHYAALVRRVKNTDKAMIEHVADSIRDGIYLNIPPYLDSMYDDYSFERSLARLEETNPKEAKKLREAHDYHEPVKASSEYPENLFIKLMQKWGVEISPVTFTSRDEGQPPRTFRTEQPVCIGSKYMFLLCKLPEPSSPGVARLSHYGVPMKAPPDARSSSVISNNPTRFGEDEQRIATMDTDSDENVRLMSLQSASPEAVEKVIETLLTHPNPTQIDRMPISDADLISQNAIIGVANHMFATMGIDAKDTPVSPDEFPDFMVSSDLDDTVGVSDPSALEEAIPDEEDD